MKTSGPMLPQHGDVVVTRDADNGNPYTIRVVPGDPQVRYPTLEKAVAVAARWAVRAHVATWLHQRWQDVHRAGTCAPSDSGVGHAEDS